MWKKISRNDNYSINEKGEVRNDRSGKVKSPFINPKNGYLTVDLYRNNKSVKVPIHRLVAEAFIPNPENKPCIDHKDGNRQNNSIENLRWATYSENNSRFNVRGVRSQKVRVTKYGEKRHDSGWGHVEWLNSEEILEFESISDCADYFSVTISNISMMLKQGTIGRRGKMRRYLFEYVDGKRVTIS